MLENYDMERTLENILKRTEQEDPDFLGFKRRDRVNIFSKGRKASGTIIKLEKKNGTVIAQVIVDLQHYADPYDGPGYGPFQIQPGDTERDFKLSELQKL